MVRTTKPAKKPTTDPLWERDQAAAALAATMPADHAGLLAVAKECVELYNTAVLDRADFAALVISERYEAAVWKLNGGTHFGSGAGEASAGAIVKRHCQAEPGAVPMWGQQGEFIICVKEIRCWVKYGGGLGSVLNCPLEFHAIDLDGPFISETGYRSHFCGPMRGLAVDAAAAAIFAGFLAKERRYLVAEYQERRATDELPAWIQALPVPARRKPAAGLDDALAPPSGFVLVDVVLTAHQAFMVRKWAAAAAPLVRAAAAAEKARRNAAPPTPHAPRREPVVVGTAALPHATAETPVLVLDDAGEPHDPADFEPGQRCRIVSVHHECFRKDLGKIVVVKAVNLDFNSVWAHDDKPVTYRINARGNRVVNSDPTCNQTIYGMISLRIIR